MLNEFAKTFLEYLKLAPRYLIALGTIAAILLFSKQQLLEYVGVAEFSQKYRSILGLILIIAFALFITSISSEAIALIKKSWRRRKLYQRVIKRLHCLTENEKQILRFYIQKNTRANLLDIRCGDVSSLISSAIIYQSTDYGNISVVAHNINEIAWDYLHKHPCLLHGETNIYRTDKHW